VATIIPAVRSTSLFRSFGRGFHQCWYPVGLSRDLAVGERIGAELCDGRIVLYRGEDGVARAMTPYCAHMGSDLSVGDVVGNDLRCAFHHWRYGPDGRCNDIPSGDRIPPAACQFTFPVEERWGLIWVFWGPEPLYDIPSFPLDDWDDERYVLHPFEAQFAEPLRVEPWVFTTNVFDIVHNRVVHGIKIADPEIIELNPYVRTMHWDASFEERGTGKWRTDIMVYGTNAISNSGAHDGRVTLQVAGSAPMGALGLRMFMVVATDRSPGAEKHLEERERLHNRLVNEDLPILNTLRFGDDHLVAADRAIAKFLRMAKDYPKATMAQLEASARPGRGS
jgi:phenylpropionate dioxygenase-like ring-hydroxylating dioxygenase large terminal subunit